MLYPALQNMNLENFHPEVIAIFFLAWAIYFMLVENYRLFYVFAVLSALGKEEMGVIVAFIGLYLLLFKKQMKVGKMTLAFGVIWYLVCFKVIMPLANGINLLSPDKPLVFSHWFGGFANNLFNLAFYRDSFFNLGVLTYLGDLFWPVLFIPLLAPAILLIGFPALAINILSNCSYLSSIYFHYNYVTTIVIYFGLIEGLFFIGKKLKAENKPRVLMLIGALLLCVGLYQNNKLSHFPLMANFPIIQGKINALQSETVKARRGGLKLIPPQASVSASYSLFPHLNHRREAYLFPNPFVPFYWTESTPMPSPKERVDYIAIVLSNHDEEQRLVLRFIMESPYFEVIYHADDVFILKRTMQDKTTGLGANYIAYALDKKIAITDDFTANLKVMGKGVFSTLYFPDSRYCFRSLMGETLPSSKVALEIFGYLFIPEDGNYKINIRTDGSYWLEVDGRRAPSLLALSRGFHKYKIKYLNYNDVNKLRITLKQFGGGEYIIPADFLMSQYDASQFSKKLAAYKPNLGRQAYLQDPSNNVINGGFEAVLNKVPEFWQPETWWGKDAHCLVGVDFDVVKKGRVAAKLEHQGLADSRWVQEVDVDPATDYCLSGWIKTVNIQKKGTGAYIAADGAGVRTEPIVGTNDWKFVQIEFKTARDQTKVAIRCRLGDYGAPNEGTAYFDEVVLRKISPR
ncbi:MAG: DUF2079 domain-containing protein [Candidatus Margulisiibacteriota bacterium]